MLRNRNFLLLWASLLISRAGDTFTFLALAVTVDGMFDQPGDSARALGMVLIAFALPQLVFGLYAGTMVDRVDRRLVMIVSDFLRAALVPAFLFIQTPADLPLAFLIAFAASSLSIFYYPARTALLPNAVHSDDLLTANSWMEVGGTIARLAGPMLAGIAIGVFGSQVAYWVDSGTFLASGILLLLIRGIETRIVPSPARAASSAWGELKTGVRYAMSSRLLQGVTIGLALALLGVGAVDVLFVPFVRFAFGAGPEALGGIMTVQGIGMLAAGLLLSAFSRRLRPVLIAVLSLILLGASVAGFGLAPTYTVELLIIPWVGFALPPLNASLQTILQQGVPREMIGRAGSVVDMGVSVAHLLSMAGAGWLGDELGLRETYLLGGALMVAGALVSWTLLRGSSRAISVSPPTETDLPAMA